VVSMPLIKSVMAMAY